MVPHQAENMEVDTLDPILLAEKENSGMARLMAWNLQQHRARLRWCRILPANATKDPCTQQMMTEALLNEFRISNPKPKFHNNDAISYFPLSRSWFVMRWPFAENANCHETCLTEFQDKWQQIQSEQSRASDWPNTRRKTRILMTPNPQTLWHSMLYFTTISV